MAKAKPFHRCRHECETQRRKNFEQDTGEHGQSGEMRGELRLIDP
jgi:hypothetical protein